MTFPLTTWQGIRHDDSTPEPPGHLRLARSGTLGRGCLNRYFCYSECKSKAFCLNTRNPGTLSHQYNFAQFPMSIIMPAIQQSWDGRGRYCEYGRFCRAPRLTPLTCGVFYCSLRRSSRGDGSVPADLDANRTAARSGLPGREGLCVRWLASRPTVPSLRDDPQADTRLRKNSRDSLVHHICAVVCPTHGDCSSCTPGWSCGLFPLPHDNSSGTVPGSRTLRIVSSANRLGVGRITRTSRLHSDSAK